MSRTHVCVVCENPGAAVVEYSERVKAGRRYVEVEGLSKIVCDVCGSETVTEEMHDANLACVRAALAASRGAISRGALRTYRESWSLTQRDASRLFGAGASSFAKWESGQAEMSVPAALLVQCAIKFPEVTRFLATWSQVPLPSRPAEVNAPRFDAHASGAYETVCLVDLGSSNATQYVIPSPGRGRHRPYSANQGRYAWDAVDVQPASAKKAVGATA